MVEEISSVDWNSPPIYDEYVDDDLSSSSVHSSMLPIAKALENAEFVLKLDYEALRFLSAQKKLNPRHAKWVSYKNFGGREERSSFQEYLKEVGQYRIAYMRDDIDGVGDIKFQDIVDMKEGSIYEYIDFIGFDIFNWKASQVLVDVVNQMKIDISWIARFFMEHESTISRIQKYSKYLFAWKGKNQFQDYNGVNKDLNSRMSFFRYKENDAVIKALLHVLQSDKSLLRIGTIKYI